MSSFGLLSDGTFRAKLVEDVIDELETDFRQAFGNDFETGPDSRAGEAIRIFADQVAENWEVLEALNSSASPDDAVGQKLDQLAAITGAIRLPATPSTVTLNLNLADTTTISIGDRVSVDGAQEFEAIESVTNSAGFQDTLAVRFESVDDGPIVGNAFTIDTIETPVAGWVAQAALNTRGSEPYTLADGQTLLVSVDGGAAQTVTFNTGDFADITNATAAEVAAVISTDLSDGDAIDAGGEVRMRSDLDGAGSSLQVTGGTAVEALGFSRRLVQGFNHDEPARILSGGTEPYALSDAETLLVQIDGGAIQTVTFNTGDFVSIGAAEALEVALVINQDITGGFAYVRDGRVEIETAGAGGGRRIQITGGTSNDELLFAENTPGQGVDGDAIQGRVTESDPDFRQRRIDLLAVGGKATGPAIRAEILQVENVVQAFVFQNRTDVTDSDGIPPHSIEAVVQGGDDTDVAQAIFDSVGAGTGTHRDPGAAGRTVAITDSEGFSEDINFTRPTEVQMFVEYDIIVDAGVFGGGDLAAGEALVQAAAVAEGSKLQIGEDVRASRIICAPQPQVVNGALVSGVAGVLEITAARFEDSFPPSNTATFPIASREIATFATADVVVNITVA